MIVKLEACAFAAVSLKVSTPRQRFRGYSRHLKPDLQVDVQPSLASG